MIGNPTPSAPVGWGNSPIQPAVRPVQLQSTLRPTTTGSLSTPSAPPSSSKPASANFDDLWDLGLGSQATSSKGAGHGVATVSKIIKDLEREKAQAGMWAPAGQGTLNLASTGATQHTTSGDDDLLL